MGYEDLLKRCLRISCVKLFACVTAGVDQCRLFLLWKRNAPRLAKERQEDDEENVGLLRRTDLGIDDREAFADKNDAELMRRARNMVETTTARELEKHKVKTPPKPLSRPPNQSLADDEVDWLEKIEAEDDIEASMVEDPDVDLFG